MVRRDRTPMFSWGKYTGDHSKYSKKNEIEGDFVPDFCQPPGESCKDDRRYTLRSSLQLSPELINLNPKLREQDTPEMVKIYENKNATPSELIDEGWLYVMEEAPDNKNDMAYRMYLHYPKNPMKTTPLFDEGDYWLADSHAIMIYLMETHGKDEHSQLYPTDKRKRASVNQRLFFDCGILFPSLQAVMAPTYTGRLGEITRSMVRRIERAYGMLEEYLKQTLYVADDVMTIADLSILSSMSSLDGICPVDKTRFPYLKRWLKNMNEKDVCKRINQPGSEEHVWGLKALMENTKHNLKSKL